MVRYGTQGRGLVIGSVMAALALVVLFAIATSPGCRCGSNKGDSGLGPENCANLIDDDGDGVVDCVDPDCSESSVCQATGEMCADGLDNDGDGDVDCFDSDCTANPACASPEDCTDGVDNNGDGLVDCDDPFCRGNSPDCGEVCGDGIDNDGDGDVDCNDADCEGLAPCTGPPVDGSICAYSGDKPHTCECADGADNDGDSDIDSFDLHCFGPLDDDESSFATGIPGDNEGTMGQIECPFDGNSGIGNDDDACCNLANPGKNATPNGCDNTGCCEIDVNGNGTGEHVRISGDCEFAPSCGAAGTHGCPCTDSNACDAGQLCVFDDDIMDGSGICSTCEPCIPNAMCENTCECGETCFGGFTQAGCGATGTDAGVGTDGGGGLVCPGGRTLCPNGNVDCDSAANETCISGCCYAQCPSGVTACTVSSDCPMAVEVCVTGCCIIIQ